MPRSLSRRCGDLVRSLRRFLLRRRRLIAALATGVAVLAGVSAVAPAAAPTTTIWVAVADLPAGAEVAEADVVRQEVAPDVVPDGTLARPWGRILAGSVRRGEPITDARVIGPGLLPADDHRVVVPVRLSDAEQAALLAPGDEVDLLATDPAEATTEVIAEDVLVLAVPSPDEGAANVGATGALGGRLVLVATSLIGADTVTGSGVSSFVTFRWTGR